MFVYKLAYRFKSGKVQGFKGFGPNEEHAEENTYKQLVSQLDFKKEEYDVKSVIASLELLTPEEKTTIERDWGVRKTEIAIRGKRYYLPEGITAVETRYSTQISDVNGLPCILYEGGYTPHVGDNQPYINTSNQIRIPLKEVE